MVQLVAMSHPQSTEEVKSQKSKFMDWTCPCRMKVWFIQLIHTSKIHRALKWLIITMQKNKCRAESRSVARVTVTAEGQGSS